MDGLEQDRPFGAWLLPQQNTLLALIVKPIMNKRQVEEKRASILIAYRLQYE